MKCLSVQIIEESEICFGKPICIMDTWNRSVVVFNPDRAPLAQVIVEDGETLDEALARLYCGREPVRLIDWHCAPPRCEAPITSVRHVQRVTVKRTTDDWLRKTGYFSRPEPKPVMHHNHKKALHRPKCIICGEPARSDCPHTKYCERCRKEIKRTAQVTYYRRHYVSTKRHDKH